MAIPAEPQHPVRSKIRNVQGRPHSSLDLLLSRSAVQIHHGLDHSAWASTCPQGSAPQFSHDTYLVSISLLVFLVAA
jgi:hypothetical protein